MCTVFPPCSDVLYHTEYFRGAKTIFPVLLFLENDLNQIVFEFYTMSLILSAKYYSLSHYILYVLIFFPSIEPIFELKLNYDF